ncbi:MAG: nucleotidyltransferase domain-containing protein [Spirochaetes bacterium]|nr:nucleotidyltransferase domain-containing protein [Spirochaetota bacterium]
MPDDGHILVWENTNPAASPGEDASILVWNTRDPLAGRTREQFEAEARRLLAGRVESAYVFGSYGTRDFGRDSDLDVMLVTRTDKRFVDRALDFADFMDLVPDMDLMVYTPEEFARLTHEPSPGFWTSAMESFKRII